MNIHVEFDDIENDLDVKLAQFIVKVITELLDFFKDLDDPGEKK